jgi:glycosyltransferase involved in cell wall biosynthesis
MRCPVPPAPTLRSRTRVIVSIHSSRNLGTWQREALSGLQASLAPHGLEHLAWLGFSLAQAAEPDWIRREPARKLRPIEARARLSVTRTLSSARVTHRAALALALLEPQAYAYSLLARFGVRPWSSTPLAALTCWLADDVRVADPATRSWLRQCTKGTDLFIYWSTNQREILAEQLGIPERRLFFVPFGIEMNYFQPREPGVEASYVLAAGLDRGRDYGTFLTAVAGLDFPVKLVCPSALVAGLTIPPNVELLGTVDKRRYRDLVQRAAVVVVPVDPEVAYPTGQTVLLNAMSCEVPTVVTGTPALSDYTRHGQNTWTVPGNDPEALREGVALVLRDTNLAREIAAGGRRDVESTFNTATMWEKIAPRLRALVDESGK